jgi:hypothetical protein
VLVNDAVLDITHTLESPLHTLAVTLPILWGLVL